MTFEDKRLERLERRVLRNLMRHGQQGEGKLALRCNQGVFMDSWQDCIRRLMEAGLVASSLTGYGHSRSMFLTEAGMAKASECNEQAAREILATVAAE